MTIFRSLPGQVIEATVTVRVRRAMWRREGDRTYRYTLVGFRDVDGNLLVWEAAGDVERDWPKGARFVIRGRFKHVRPGADAPVVVLTHVEAIPSRQKTLYEGSNYPHPGDKRA